MHNTRRKIYFEKIPAGHCELIIPAIAWSHGQMGFHGLISTEIKNYFAKSVVLFPK